jgi:hypothetical protein
MFEQPRVGDVVIVPQVAGSDAVEGLPCAGAVPGIVKRPGEGSSGWAWDWTASAASVSARSARAVSHLASPSQICIGAVRRCGGLRPN